MSLSIDNGPPDDAPAVGNDVASPATNLSPTAVGPTPNDAVDLHASSLYINRELSWLEFNKRVLLQALDEKHPLLERVKFLAIAGTNLDEFYMVRVATLLRKFRNDIEDVSPDGLNTSEQLAAIRQHAGAMLNKMGSCWAAVLRPQLEEHRIRFLEPDDYTDQIRRYLASYFRDNIHPVLTPLAFDPGHPFPFISNLSMNLAVAVRHDHRTRFARVKLPDVLSRFIHLPEAIAGPVGETFVFLEDVVRDNIVVLFPGARVLEAYLFRIIRDTDMVIQEDEADDLLESVDRTLKQLRYGDLSQLLVESAMPARVLDILIENFEIEDDVLVKTSERMGFGDFSELTRPAPSAAQGSTVLSAPRVGRRRHRDDLRPDPRARPSRASSIRFVSRRSEAFLQARG